MTAIWGGLYLRATAPMDLTSYSALRFVAQATQPGQSYGVFFVDALGQTVGTPVVLADFIGDPLPGQ